MSETTDAMWKCKECGEHFTNEGDVQAHQINKHSFTLTEKEAVNHPSHYGGADNPYEVIKIIEAYNLNFALGSVLKHMLRNPKKKSEVINRKGFEHGQRTEDLKKAAWYLNREIENLEAREK